MKIYIAIYEDRHFGVEVYPFSEKEAAIAWAKKEAHGNNEGDDKVDQQLTPSMIRDGLVYYGVYSGEGDCISVVEKEMAIESRTNQKICGKE